MDVPERLREYPCAEYFTDGWSTRGHFDDESQTLVVTTMTDSYEDRDLGFFAVGRSGCGGIDFGYRRGLEGLWAYYPIDREFRFMAPTIAELVDRWCSGDLAV